MESARNLIYDVIKRILAVCPRFEDEIAATNIEYRTDLEYHTAATDGKTIFIDPEYFSSLSDKDRMFLVLHEFMHIKFGHVRRLKDKEGNKRDLAIWNEATDAIINANLERDGFSIKEGYVNRPESKKYTAEEFYQILLQEKENSHKSDNQKNNQGEKSGQTDKDNQGEQTNQSGQESKGEQSNKDDSNTEPSKGENAEGGGKPASDHSLWEEAFYKYQSGEKAKEQDSSDKKEEKAETQEFSEDTNEKEEFEANRREKVERFKRRREKTEREMRGESTIQLGEVGESRDSIDWKFLVRREINKTETVWSQRRSIEENNYAYRLEEYDVEEEAETEVMIDVSGSVDLELVKAFLRELKPLLMHSKLRVGCFNEKFWGMVDIKSIRDIDNFTIPKQARGDSAWTEDWDLAVRSFSKKREINKIVFTDGYPCPGTMPRNDLSRENIIWLVYGNENFSPCCGKVINITEKQLRKLNQMGRDR